MANSPIYLTLRHVTAQLAEHGIPAAVMGGLAVAFWQHPRMTRDVDVLIGIDPPSPDELLSIMQSAGCRPKRVPPLVEIDRHRFMQLLYTPKDTYVDIPVDLLFADSEFLRSALQRRTPIQVPAVGIDTLAVSCEDVIILKLSADRMIDRMDAINLLRFNHETLDFNYLSKWIIELRLANDWAAAWAQAFPGEASPITCSSPLTT